MENYSDMKKMKSIIKFEVYKSNSEVNFLDVSIKLLDGSLSTSLFCKATDAHLYLNYSSNHPKHVLNDIPKGQFIRIRRICSDVDAYNRHSQTLCNFFIERGFNIEKLNEVRRDVGKMNRMDLLKDNQKRKRDPQTIFVCNWHPSLSRIPSILKQHYHILQSDERLSNVFQEVPTVAFRRPRTIRNHLVRNDIRPAEKKASSTSECGSCILCKNICKNPTVTNTKKKITVKLKEGGNCKTKTVIYVVRCKKCFCMQGTQEMIWQIDSESIDLTSRNAQTTASLQSTSTPGMP